jgi:hypothetical protein|tara:strand:+ start:35 stop:538 length:504 start_codon:yes stop_codon:yes gene_type:complete
VTKEKKYMNDFELLTFASEMEKNMNNEDYRPDSDKLDTLMAMYYERFGTATNGMCLNPRTLVQGTIEHGQTVSIPNLEKEDVASWNEKDIFDIFDEIKDKPKDISKDFMCKRPIDCLSHQQNKFACRCIRENFDSPSQFKTWVDKQITELGTELQDLLPKPKIKKTH